MADLSIQEIKLIEILVLKKGFIRTSGKRFHFPGKGQVYVKGSTDIYCTISGKVIKHLYRELELLTCRQVSALGWEAVDYYTYWEVYMPNLFEFECLKELQVQYSIGTV